MGLFQVSQIFAAREVLYHAAARGARAKTVGFNRWMVEKASRVAAIPNAGKMVVPDIDLADITLQEKVAGLKPGDLWSWVMGTTPTSPQFNIERARIPEYMGSETRAQAKFILDYTDWDSVDYVISPFADPILHVKARQEYPLRIPLHRIFYAADTLNLEGEAYIDNHYPLYIEDMNW